MNANSATLTPRAEADMTVVATAQPVLPPDLERALVEFGLMPAFLAQPRSRQREHIHFVEGSPDDRAARDRIADVLDELALATFSPYRWSPERSTIR